MDEEVARQLTDVDFLFLASDSIQSRFVFNSLVHQYLIPGAQIGAKVPVDKDTGKVGEIFVATRPVLPYDEGGCLQCHGVIPPSRLQEEALTEGERRAQRYVDFEGVAEPSVITLNVLSAAQAANDLMMMFTELYQDETTMPQQLNFVRDRHLITIEPRSDEDCLSCSNEARSRFARGDRVRLPCRMQGPT